MKLEQRDLDEALNDANAGLEKCNTVIEFLRRRQQIEEDYAKSMSTHLILSYREVVHFCQCQTS